MSIADNEASRTESDISDTKVLNGQVLVQHKITRYITTDILMSAAATETPRPRSLSKHKATKTPRNRSLLKQKVTYQPHNSNPWSDSGSVQDNWRFHRCPDTDFFPNKTYLTRNAIVLCRLIVVQCMIIGGCTTSDVHCSN